LPERIRPGSSGRSRRRVDADDVDTVDAIDDSFD